MPHSQTHCGCCPECVSTPCLESQANIGCASICFCEPDNDIQELDFDNDDIADCFQMMDGTCGAVGSEYCEFECPYRNR